MVGFPSQFIKNSALHLEVLQLEFILFTIQRKICVTYCVDLRPIFGYMRRLDVDMHLFFRELGMFCALFSFIWDQWNRICARLEDLCYQISDICALLYDLCDQNEKICPQTNNISDNPNKDKSSATLSKMTSKPSSSSVCYAPYSVLFETNGLGYAPD